MNYAQQLKDVRWQKRRIKILNERGLVCAHCKTSDQQVQVHHGAYLREVMLWDYPDEMLHVLCEKCHKFVTIEIDGFMRFFGRLSINEVENLGLYFIPFYYTFNAKHGGVFDAMSVLTNSDCLGRESLARELIEQITEILISTHEGASYELGLEEGRAIEKQEALARIPMIENSLPKSSSSKTSSKGPA